MNSTYLIFAGQRKKFFLYSGLLQTFDLFFGADYKSDTIHQPGLKFYISICSSFTFFKIIDLNKIKGYN